MEARADSGSIEILSEKSIHNDLKYALINAFRHLLNRIDDEFIYPPDVNISDVDVSESIHLFDVQIWLDTQYLDMRISMKAIKEDEQR